MVLCIDFKDLLTPFIAVTGLWIAYHQWQTNRDKLKLDLFERRLVVYDAAKAYLHYIIQNRDADVEAGRKFLYGIALSHYIFNDKGKVDFYLREQIYANSNRLVEMNNALESLRTCS